MTAGFRLFEGYGIRDSGGAGVIAYRLDPATLAVCEIGGQTQDLFGYPPEEWRQPHFWRDHLHPEDREASREFCREWRERPCSHAAQYRLIGPDGGVRWVHDIVEVRHGEGGEEIRGVLVDVTDRMAHAADLHAAQRLRHELLRIVAEELAGSVRTVSAYSELLARRLSAQRDDVGGDYAVGVREGVQRIETVMAGLMRVAQGGGETLEDMAEGLAAIRSRGREPP